MRTFFLLLFSFLSVFHFAKAQHDSAFLPGWVALQNGDTLRGLVFDSRFSDEKVYTPVKFKATEESEIRPLHRSEVLAFKIRRDLPKRQRGKISPNTYFQRFFVQIDTTEKQNDALLPTKYMPRWKEDTIFLQLMIKGSMSLYRYKKRHQHEHFFVSINGAKPEELLHAYEAPTQGTRREVKHFVNQLEGYFMEHCGKSMGYKPEKFLYNQLKKVVFAFNRSCIKAKNKYVYHREKNKIYGTLFLGGGTSVIEMYQDNVLGYTRRYSGNSILAGAELETSLPFTRSRAFFCFGVSYELINVQSEEQIYSPEANNHITEDLYYSNVMLSSQIKYYFFKRAKFSPYL